MIPRSPNRRRYPRGLVPVLAAIVACAFTPSALCYPVLSAAIDNESGSSTPSTSESPVTAVWGAATLSTTISMPTSGSALVLSTFVGTTTEGSPMGYTGSWDLYSGGSPVSSTIDMNLTGSNDVDTSIGGLVTIVEGISDSQTFELRHSKSGAGNVVTESGSLVAIPLVTDTGTALSYGVDTEASDSTSSTSWSDVSGLSTSVTMTWGGDMFIAASFNGSADAAVDGEWQLVVDDVAVGTVTRTDLSSTSDVDAVTVFAIAEGLDAGSHTVELQARSVAGGTSVTTSNATLAAVSLQVTEDLAFRSFQGSDDSFTTTSGTAQDVASAGLTLDEAGQVFLAGSYYSGATGTGTSARQLSQLAVGGYESGEVERYPDGGSTVYGSGANLGLTTLAAGNHTPLLQGWGSGAGTIGLYNTNIAGFAMTATPEPGTAVMALLACLVCGPYLRRRRSRRGGDGS